MTPIIIELIIRALLPIGIGVGAGALIGFIGYRYLRRTMVKQHAEYMEAIRKNTEAWDRCKCQDKFQRLWTEDTH